jgi:hypothetical protein
MSMIEEYVAVGGNTVPQQALPPAVEMVVEQSPAMPPELAVTVNEDIASDPGASETLKNAGAVSAVVAGAPGAFESIWGATLITTAQLTHSPYMAAGAAILATFAIEAGSAWGAARLLATDKGQLAMAHVRKGLSKLGVKDRVETNLTTDVAVAFMAGTAAMTMVKQEANPERTEPENRRHGFKVAAIVTALAAPLTLAAAEGAVDITKEKVALGAIAVAGLFAVGRKVKKYIRERVQKAREQRQSLKVVHSEASYELSEEQCNLLERQLVDRVREQHGRTVAAVWMDGRRPEANLIRTREAQAFPDIDIEGLFSDYDDSSMFLAFVDTRRSQGEGRVIRGTRLSGRHFSSDMSSQEINVDQDGGTNMAMFRDMIVDGELTGQEVADYYRDRGINLPNCISVETNFKIGERSRRRWGLIPMAQLGYLAMYNYVRKVDSTGGDESAIFAHINKASRDSLTRLGATLEPVAGRADLKTPAGAGSGERYDDKFAPIAMLNTPETKRAMRKKLLAAPPEIYLTATQAA